ncbi:hypothetical protein HN51_050479 [Arachis hypogaea]|nr:probable transcription factor PosF21 [Arachis ipaensis]XP_029150091.1 probable transcription factor PosF21 [Arachis hypogaea]QHN92242.1 Transcription factor RF2a [Arachis hypogaea]
MTIDRNGKRNIGSDDERLEEQSWPKKPTLIKPLPLRNSAKTPLCFGSSFKPWKNPSHDSIIIDCDQDNHTNEVQLGSSSNTNLEMDPKRLKRIMANRNSAQKTREKNNAYVADLENKSKGYEEQIAVILSQIESEQSQVNTLRMEQHKLKLLMATCEKQRLIQEASIEKNKGEVERLRGLQLKLADEAKQARVLLPSSGFGPFIRNNSIQGLNGVESARRQVDSTTQHPQNRERQGMMMPSWNNTSLMMRTSIPDLNIAKPDPES